MPTQLSILFTIVFLLSACGKVGPYVPVNTPPLTTQEANDVTGNVNGKEWFMHMGDARVTSSNGKKVLSLRLSDSTDLASCTPDKKTAYTDRRIYFTVDAKLGETNMGENYGSAYFSYYRKDSSNVYEYTVQQGTVKITSLTDQTVEGTIQAAGYSQNASGFFSVPLCSH